MKNFVAVIAVLFMCLAWSGIADASGEVFLNKQIDDNSGYELSWKHVYDNNLYIKGDLGFESLERVTRKELEVGGQLPLNEQTTLVGSVEVDDFGSGDEYAAMGAIDVQIYKQVTLRNQYKYREKQDAPIDRRVYIGIGYKY